MRCSIRPKLASEEQIQRERSTYVKRTLNFWTCEDVCTRNSGFQLMQPYAMFCFLKNLHSYMKQIKSFEYFKIDVPEIECIYSDAQRRQLLVHGLGCRYMQRQNLQL